MFPAEWMSLPWFSMGVLPLMIFLGRIVDVSIGTIRVIYVGRGHRVQAAVLGFFEVLIWLTIISQIMQNLTNPVLYIGYAAGFGMGNYIGIRLEERLAVGYQAVRVITAQACDDLVQALRDQRIGVTVVEGRGAEGAVSMLYMVARRRDINHTLEIVRQYAPDAFVNVNEIRSARGGVFPKVGFAGEGAASHSRRPFGAQNPLRRKDK